LTAKLILLSARIYTDFLNNEKQWDTRYLVRESALVIIKK